MQLRRWLVALMALALLALFGVSAALAAPATQATQTIIITSPLPGTFVGSPMTVTGRTTVFPFEANLNYRVTDAASKEIGSGFITVSGEMGQPSTFNAPVIFAPPATAQEITLAIFEIDAATGAERGTATVKLRVAGAEELTTSGWKLASIGENRSLKPVLEGTEITLVANSDGALAGSAGCNTYRGSFTLDGAKLTVSPLATTRKLCEDAVMQQEQTYLAALQAADSARIQDGRLLITYNKGTSLLAYDRVDAPAQTKPAPQQPIPTQTITFTSPAPNAWVGTPFIITGRTSKFPFEGNLVYRVTDAAGAEIGAGNFQVDNECCGPSTFKAGIFFIPPPAGGPISLEVYEIDAATGAKAGSSSLALRVAPQASLTNTNWQLSAYGPLTAVAPALDAPANVIQFGTDGRVSGTVGCNSISGSFTTEGNTLKMSGLATTLRACAGPGVDEQGNAVAKGLNAANSYTILSQRLIIGYDNNQGVLVFDAVPVDTTAAPVPPATTSAVTGTVTKLDRSALPPTAVVTVRLQDTSRAGAPAITIAEQIIPLNGQQLPVPFSLSYDPAKIDPRFTYTVRAIIEDGGKLIYTSTQAYPVITRDAPTSNVEIQVQAVP